MNLRPYQLRGSEFLKSRKTALLADSPGLGKTAQVASVLDPSKGALVVAPAVAKGVWEREIRKWRQDLRPTILKGGGSFRWPSPGEVVITNYDILPDSPAYVRGLRQRQKPIDPARLMPAIVPEGVTLVADEAHYCKSPKAERTRATKQIVKAVRGQRGSVYSLTGTPIKNTPLDLYHLLDTFDLLKDSFWSYPSFIKEMGGHKSGYDWIWDGPTELAKKLLDRIMLRRTVEQVLPDLPKKQTSIIPVEISSIDKREVERIIANAGWTLEDITEHTLHQFLNNEHMMRARACLASAKLSAATEWCNQMEDSGESVVVFSWHREPLERLAKRPGWALINGSTPAAKRTQIEDAFQRGELKGIAANTLAGGVSITLTRACYALILDKSFVPAENEQVEGRLVRYGQKRPVTFYEAVADHPLDERLNEILANKSSDAEMILRDKERSFDQRFEELF